MKRHTITMAACGLGAIAAALMAGALVSAGPGSVVWWTDGAHVREREGASPTRRVLWGPSRPSGPGADADEYEPRLSFDGATMVMVMRRAGTNADLFTSHRTPTGWSAPEPISALNTEHDELGPELSHDGGALYFYSDRPGGFGGYDLWVARASASGWGEPVNVGATVNTAGNEYGPALTPDGATLYFSSNHERAAAVATQGAPWAATLRKERDRRDYDVYSCALRDGGAGEPEPVGAINTDADEGAPAVSPGGDFLYFASDRAGGTGGFDLWRARLAGGTVGVPENLGAAINSPRNEMDPGLSSDGFRLYFSTDRARPGDPALSDAPARYSIWCSVTREVYEEVERRAPAPGLGAMWDAAWPWLLLLLVMGALMAWLALLLKSELWRRRLGQLSLMARCVLVSLVIHAVAASGLAVWKVGSGLLEATRSEGGARVMIESAGGEAELGEQLFAPVSGEARPAVPLQLVAAPPLNAVLTGESVRVELPAQRSRELSLPGSQHRDTPVPTSDPTERAALPEVPVPSEHGKEPATSGPPLRFTHAALAVERVARASRANVPAPTIDEVAETTPYVSDEDAITEARPAEPTVPAASLTLDEGSNARIPALASVTADPAEDPVASRMLPRLGAPSNLTETIGVRRVDAALPKAVRGEESSVVMMDSVPEPSPVQATKGLDAPITPALGEPFGGVRLPGVKPVLDGGGESRTALSRYAPIPPSLSARHEPAGVGARVSIALAAPGASEHHDEAPLIVAVEPGRAASRASAVSTGDAPRPPLADVLASLRMPTVSDEPVKPIETFAQRSPEVRSEVLEKMGGSVETERAVGLALEWFARHQQDDGRWAGRGFDDACGKCAGAGEVNADAAMTGMVLLCYLGAGHTHQAEGPYRATAERALRWLVSRQASDGDLRRGETMYGQTVATVALCEALSMTSDQELAGPARRAVAFVLGASARRGATGADTAVLGWLVMAVESARRAGIDVPPDTFQSAGRWIGRVEVPGAPGRYAYRPGGAASVEMTAEAMFVRQLLGHGRTEAVMDESARFVASALPRWTDGAPTHHWYYATLALFEHQGPSWESWNAALVPELIGRQRADGAAAGSWDPSDPTSRLGGRVYQTAVCTLSLEAYYRYAPR